MRALTDTDRAARPSGRPGHGSRLVAMVAGWAVLAALLVGAAGPAQAQAPTPTPAVTFNPGFIISDELFTASTSMTEADVQAFLDAKGAGCRPGPDGTPCLKDYRQDTTDRPADSRCLGPYTGAPAERAARIIVKVARACGISPKALLVILQKEQGLVTGSGTGLYAKRYESAMGFGCPDTAPCDPRYAGFFNQVHRAAWRFRDYALAPDRFSHRVGVVNNVRFHPDPACGSAPVLILNRATAGLYNYTPYQPNAAALAAGAGAGDACSAYGNRNFWRYYTEWFGSPTGKAPVGNVEAVTATNTDITVAGWTLDPDTSVSNDVHVYVDGVGSSAKADLPRADVAAAHRLGDRHGFSVTRAAAPGPHDVCVFGISYGLGENALLGCRTVVVPDAAPIGVLESVTVSVKALTVSGWTLDPDTTAPTDVHVYIDGVGARLVADQPRPDVAAAHRKGDRHGFAYTAMLAPGVHEACVYAINTVAGAHTPLGCRTVTVPGPDRAPIGALDAVTASGSELTIAGWTMDPDTSASNDVHVYVDGGGVALPADGHRPDVGAAFRNGDRHGFTHTRTVPDGVHRVCVYGINTGAGPHTLLGCRTVTTRNAAPIGSIDQVSAVGSQLTVSGWTLDPDTTAPTAAHIYVDGVGVAVLADAPRADVAAAFGLGDRRGYSYTRTVPPGAHEVCVYAINTTPGAHTLLGCRRITTGG